MQTNRKQIGILIIALGLVIILLIIYFVFSNKKTSVTEGPQSGDVNTEISLEPRVGTTTPGDAPRNYQKYNVDNEPAHVTTADDLGKIAMSLAERFGSYSNQSNYGNFTDLKILMTDEMKSWSDAYVEKLKKQPQNSNVYYGITTKALTYEVKIFNDKTGQAEIVVSTQRRESTEKINGGEAYNQDLTIGLLKVDGEWLFDKATWSK